MTQGTDQRTSHGVAVGEVIHGFCGGYFGRDSYGCRRVEAVGHDWILTRKIDPDSAPQVEMVAGRDAIGVAAEMTGAFALLYCDHEGDDAEDPDEFTMEATSGTADAGVSR